MIFLFIVATQAATLASDNSTSVNNVLGGWDTHVNNFEKLEQKLPEVDTAIAALVKDLEVEGLLDSNYFNLLFIQKRMKEPQCVRATSNTSY